MFLSIWLSSENKSQYTGSESMNKPIQMTETICTAVLTHVFVSLLHPVCSAASKLIISLENLWLNAIVFDCHDKRLDLSNFRNILEKSLFQLYQKEIFKIDTDVVLFLFLFSLLSSLSLSLFLFSIHSIPTSTESIEQICNIY